MNRNSLNYYSAEANWLNNHAKKEIEPGEKKTED